jgi:hypothetical protein
VFRRLLRADERTDFTLDIDPTQIVAEKREARYSYKGQKGYMPMVGQGHEAPGRRQRTSHGGGRRVLP